MPDIHSIKLIIDERDLIESEIPHKAIKGLSIGEFSEKTSTVRPRRFTISPIVDGCQFYTHCLSCPLPKCIYDESMHTQLMKIRLFKKPSPRDLRGVSKAHIKKDNIYDVKWDWRLVTRLFQTDTRRKIREYFKTYRKTHKVDL